MSRRNKMLNLLALVALSALAAWSMVSCGGGGGGGSAPAPTPQQAAASSSSAMGAVQLSSTVGQASSMAKGAIPAGFAPGKTARPDTSAIANIDPRLKDVVDKMLIQLQKPASRGHLAKARSFKTISAPLLATSISATVPCDSGGNYVVSGSTSTTATTTTDTLSVTYNNCKDSLSLSITSGSLSATQTIDSAVPSDSANVTMNNYTETTYTNTNFTVASDIFSLDGVFTDVINRSGADGQSAARGSFSMTSVDAVNGNMVMTFNFGSGTTPVTNSWTYSSSAGTTTEVNTSNGTYGLSITMPGIQPISLGITLTNLVDKVVLNSAGKDEWINGSVGISWTPDLSQFGCLGGTYVFTTADATPIHTPTLSSCPTSGKMTVNGATIEYGKPSGVKITVTSGATSQEFTDCIALESGACM